MERITWQYRTILRSKFKSKKRGGKKNNNGLCKMNQIQKNKLHAINLCMHLNCIDE